MGEQSERVRYLERDDAVAEGAEAVHPIGSPNIHSQNSTGACAPCVSLCNLTYAGHFNMLGECWLSFVVSVGKNPPSRA